jgi:fumarate reductase flavoprotein subunit
MQQTMTDQVGIFRHGERLQAAVSTLKELLLRSENIGLRSQVSGANPELVAAYRVKKMLKLALCVSAGALQRTESRGAHYREDYPRRDDQQWLSRTLAHWPSADATGPCFEYEPLDVKTMELPPGWRGYGSKDQIEHPDTAPRNAAVARCREQIPDRAAQQAAVMPFEHLLPTQFRGRNARLGEDDND